MDLEVWKNNVYSIALALYAFNSTHSICNKIGYLIATTEYSEYVNESHEHRHSRQVIMPELFEKKKKTPKYYDIECTK